MTAEVSASRSAPVPRRGKSARAPARRVAVPAGDDASPRLRLRTMIAAARRDGRTVVVSLMGAKQGWEEAVQLSDRIIVLRHGGQIHADIPIDLPHPRRASDPEVAAVQAEILGRFETMDVVVEEEATAA